MTRWCPRLRTSTRLVRSVWAGWQQGRLYCCHCTVPCRCRTLVAAHVVGSALHLRLWPFPACAGLSPAPCLPTHASAAVPNALLPPACPALQTVRGTRRRRASGPASMQWAEQQMGWAAAWCRRQAAAPGPGSAAPSCARARPPPRTAHAAAAAAAACGGGGAGARRAVLHSPHTLTSETLGQGKAQAPAHPCGP